MCELEGEMVSRAELDLAVVRAARALTAAHILRHAGDVVDSSSKGVDTTLQELCVAYADAADNIRSVIQAGRPAVCCIVLLLM